MRRPSASKIRQSNQENLVRWIPTDPEGILTVLSVATGQTYLMARRDHGKIGTDQRIAVLERTEAGNLERVFVGRFLELTDRLVLPRRTAGWDGDLCDRPVDGECECELPHLRDHSADVDARAVGEVVTRTRAEGFTRYKITKIDASGAWGRALLDEGVRQSGSAPQRVPTPPSPAGGACDPWFDSRCSHRQT